MGVGKYLEYWGGLPVHWLEAPVDLEAASPEMRNLLTMSPNSRPTTWAEVGAAAPRADRVAWGLATAYDSDVSYTEVFEGFLQAVDTTRVRSLLLGYWGKGILSREPANLPAELLCAHADRFPALRSLFVGHITSDQHEISWIPRGDVTQVLESFPELEELTYRFGQRSNRDEPSDVLRPVRHERLRRLTLETGGLPAHVPGAIAACDFPALEHLDVWLGVEFYGGDATVRDLDALLVGASLPRLRHLGMMNSEIQNDIATALAAAPIVARLASLDLSMGTLSDAGVEALLTGQPLTHLQNLTVEHHFVSESMARRLRDLLESAGVEVTMPAAEELYDWLIDEGQEGRYTQVSE
ncbi:STM4015 family protein [Yinghuangia sp. ASG 101]|uniref:STM4015 family protein n=1 Tax=Yinghuangia sp. ASG 101 TaxID=2896848 RepID=UPI001E60969D|nr:STM4015 family protein [Yinghuangia sp. ASG 101]UGQ11446.1 STM4015 family protein [Yinghuangia sp. ASG 101]